MDQNDLFGSILVHLGPPTVLWPFLRERKGKTIKKAKNSLKNQKARIPKSKEKKIRECHMRNFYLLKGFRLCTETRIHKLIWEGAKVSHKRVFALLGGVTSRS